MPSLVAAVRWPEAAPVPVDEGVTRYNVRIIAGRYRVERSLGAGGFGVVHQVLDQASGRRLALKQLKPPTDLHSARRLELGFRREFHTLASLRHPNIVQAHDFGVEAQSSFYTMELLDGRELRRSSLPARRVCKILRDVASALAFLHSRRLIHGDVSRRNVGCDARGTTKLLDFGLLVTVGDTGKGRGTLPYMAPEVARRAPLDHRTDLFSLGALAYLLLTGRHAFPRGSLEEMERHWARRPPPPLRLVPAVPRALSDLVVSLLSVDPLGRPSSAAEVIDRLRGVDATPEVSPRKVARGYLASSVLVGRKREMTVLREALAGARRGKGGTVVLEAPSGLGKSRILKEIAVEGQMAGVRVLSVACQAGGRGPYAVLYELLGGLVRASTPPDGLTVLHRPDSALPALRRWVGIEAPDSDPTRARVRLQQLLVERVLGEVSRQPLMLLVDDLQRCDEASAAVLATLAYRAAGCPLVLVCARRTDEAMTAPNTLGQLRRHATALELVGLQAGEVQQLVRAVFGDVDHVERLARWMHGASAGSPLRCTELARHLVEQGKVRYRNGVWCIPEGIGSGAVPGDLMHATTERIGTLGLGALELAETLAIHGGELSLELCVGLSDEKGEQEIFGALDELVKKGFLVGGRDRMRLSHDGIREALLAGMSEGRRRQVHLRVGRMLQRAGGCQEATGWHLLRGGADLEGAELLAAAGARHFDAQSFSDAVGPLEVALEVFERHGVSPACCCELRQNLVRAGLICNREVALRHGGPLLAELRARSGLDRADVLRRWMGRGLALLVALVMAWLRWLLCRSATRGPSPRQALHGFVGMVNYVAAVRALSFDIGGVRSMPALLDPLPPRATSVRCAHWLCRNFELILTGHWADAAENARRYLDVAHALRRLRQAPLDLHMGEGAMRFMLAFTTAHRGGPKCLGYLKRLEAADLHFLEVSGRIGRVLYHRLRGEEPLARRLEAETKVLMVQLGSMWLWESLLVWISAIGHALTRNLPGLKRSIEELEQLVAQGVAAGPFLDLARGVYHQERGELEASRRVLSRLAHGATCQENPLVRQVALCALARTLLLQNDLHGAVAVARQGAEMGTDPHSGIVHFHVLSAGVLAVAHARGGESKRAVRRLERMLEALPDNPLLQGTLHEYTADAAGCAGDRERVARHLDLARGWFRSTGNPALMARVEKLSAAIQPAGEGQISVPGPCVATGQETATM